MRSPAGVLCINHLLSVYNGLGRVEEHLITFINNIGHSLGPFGRQEIFAYLMLALYEAPIGDLHKE